MKIKFIISTLFLLLPVITLSAEEKDNKSLAKTPGGTAFISFNINNISTWIYNTGESDISPNGNSGFEYPFGSDKHVVFQSGLLWGGKIDGQVRVGGSAYRTGLTPGKILNDNLPVSELIAADTTALTARIFKVRPDYTYASFSHEIGMGEGTKADIFEKYKKDWNDWPANDGAPFTDMNNNGVYEPAIDIPGVPGASQTIWFVANDLDPEQTGLLYGSTPMGFEVQVTVWGYKNISPLNNVLFKKYKLINKSNKPFTEMYVSMFVDPDVGDAGDDFIGTDTLHNLIYAYNASPSDWYYPYPPAVGFSLLQGPIVDGLTQDSAFFDNRIIHNKKNLPITASYFFECGLNVYPHPQQGNYSLGTLFFYDYMHGIVPSTGQYFPVPNEAGGGYTPFPLSGDPVSQTGWYAGINSQGCGDVYMGMASGPFTIMPGDTQEVVFAELAAGGNKEFTNITVVNLLKNYAVAVNELFRNNISLTVNTKPVVSATGYERKVVLTWGQDVQSVKEIEEYNKKGFVFEGYNVFQLPYKNAPLSEGKRIATFDKVNNVGYIIGGDIDSEIGVDIESVQQHGTNSGVERSFIIDRDYINDKALNDGSEYHYAVNAYFYNINKSIPSNIETFPTYVSVTPQSAEPGTRYGADLGDIKIIEDTSGVSLFIKYVDPANLTGDTYKINLEYTDDYYWNLFNSTKDIDVLSGQTNTSGNGEYAITDGYQVKVTAPEPGVQHYLMDITPAFLSPAIDGMNLESFEGSLGWGSPAGQKGFKVVIKETVSAKQLKKVELRFAYVPENKSFENPFISSNDPNISYGYRYLNNADKVPAKEEFAKYINNASEGMAFQDFSKSVPLSAWAEDNVLGWRRLVVGFSENNISNGLLDGRYFPPLGIYRNVINTSDTSPMEWLFIFDKDYSEQPDISLMKDIKNEPLPVMFWMTAVRTGEGTFSPNGTGTYKFTILPRLPVTSKTLEFTVPGVTISKNFAEQDVDKVNVFPNPYYGINPLGQGESDRFVMFNHLPRYAKIRIFNLAGHLIRTIEKDSPDQFSQWDLLNEHEMYVASGVYIIHIEMPELGKTKILKLALIQQM